MQEGGIPGLFFLSIYPVSLSFIIRKYIAIVSYEQRQNYKDDFNAEYDEYRALHARMETVARRFIKLDAQRKRLSPGSKEYQVDRLVSTLLSLLAIALARASYLADQPQCCFRKQMDLK